MTQLFPEGGNLGLLLPPALSEWTTQQVKNGEWGLSGLCSVNKVLCSDCFVPVSRGCLSTAQHNN